MMQVPSHVLNSRVIAKPLPREEETVGSIVIAETANAELDKAEVVMVAGDLGDTIKAGDVILYPAKAGLGQILNGAPHLWLRQDEIWAIL